MFFTSGGGVDEVLQRLKLIENVIKIKTRCAFHSVSNIHTDFRN